MIGSFFLSFTIGLIFVYTILNSNLAELYPQYFNFFYINLNDFWLLIFIFLISAVSQAGDLVISYFKRLAKIKNTGNIIPGHGGLLDRVDGIIFAIPAAVLFYNFQACYINKLFCFGLLDFSLINF